MTGRQRCTNRRSTHRRLGLAATARDRQLAVVDFFCGAGGFTCGSLLAGAKMVCGIDCDGRARKTYQENNRNGEGPAPFIHARIEDLNPMHLGELLELYEQHPVLFVGCPPCQPFTNLRTSKERSASSRDSLRLFIDHVVALAPDFVLVENVPGIRAKKYGNLWDETVARLRDAGYRLRSEIVNAARFGVPQKRLRILLVAARDAEPPWPQPTHEPNEYRTVRDAFTPPGLLCGPSLCQVEPGQRCEHDAQQSASLLSELNLRRVRAIRRPGGSRTEWPSDLELACYRGHEGHTDVYGRMDWGRPSPTLTTRFVSLSNGRFGHPEENRAITPREGALLQTFPPEYRFYDASRDMNVIHIGNAVPPRLAQAFVAAIVESVRGIGDR
jgi:DNA (cytosine-5)-methyltransferase 1